MWKLVLAILVGVVLWSSITAISKPKVITIKDDPGGYLTEYQERISAAMDAGTPVMILGECASACVLWTVMQSLDKLCVGRGATLLLHQVTIDPEHPQAHDVSPEDLEEATRWYINSLPAWLQNEVAVRGGLSSEWLVVTYETMRDAGVPTCTAGWKSVT